MGSLETGFMLLAIGMSTVFFILLLIIFLGEKMILLINHFVPETVITLSKSADNASRGTQDAGKIAAISAAIHVVTKGKGKVVEIHKQS